MVSSKALLIGAVAFIGFAAAQSIDLDRCINPLTSVSNCDYFNSNLAKCNSLRGSAVGTCYCPQTVFNALAGCQGEFRICNGNTNFDFEFEDPESGLYALWHSACDNFNTYIVTTPSIVETPATISAEGCASNYDDCFRISDIHASCTRSFSSGTGRSSCLCQSTNLAIASRCEIDGASCLQSAIATSKLYSYNYCPNGAAPAGQMTVPASTSPGGPSVTNGGSGGVTTVSSPSGPTSVVSVPGVFSTLSTTTESHAHQLRLGLTSLGPVVFASNLLLGLFL